MLSLRNKIISKIGNFVSPIFTLRSARCLSSGTGSTEQTIPCEEIRIPVPWGHIAGKWWGPQNKRPILVLHGWQDNCGSFDRLIPLLPNDVGYLAVDFPGHGRSSRIPPGMFYHFMNGPITICKIKEHFQWPKITCMGHSLGAVMSYTYGSLFPQFIDFMVCIDALSPLVFKNRIDVTIKSIEQFIKYDNLNIKTEEPPSYNLEEMSVILNKGTRNSISIENCKYILERNIEPSKKNVGKYYFSRDARLKCGPLLGWTEADIFEAAKRVNFPILLTSADGTPFDSQKPVVDQCVKIIKQNGKCFKFHPLKGTHHVHLNDPKQVADVVSPFIREQNLLCERSEGGDITKCSKL